jgi:hypothetical protein
MSQKASDRSCVPLCFDCHQAHPISYHRDRAGLGIDFPALVAHLNEVYGLMAEYARGQE